MEINFFHCLFVNLYILVRQLIVIFELKFGDSDRDLQQPINCRVIQSELMEEKSTIAIKQLKKIRPRVYTKAVCVSRDGAGSDVGAVAGRRELYILVEVDNVFEREVLEGEKNKVIWQTKKQRGEVFGLGEGGGSGRHSFFLQIEVNSLQTHNFFPISDHSRERSCRFLGFRLIPNKV
jgi:hypothetical protein